MSGSFVKLNEILFPGKKSSSSEDEGNYPPTVINKGVGELPPGAALSDSDENDTKDSNDPHRALNIDLDLPLREDEHLPTVQYRSSDTHTIHNLTDKTVNESDKVRL